jgi:cation diffusion facilitator family transporter
MHRAALRVARVGLGVNGLLACATLVVGVLSRSTAVLASGVEFTGDVLASAIVLAGVRAAARPADAEHPYGHGRFEMLAGFSVGVVLIAAGVLTCYYSLQAIGVRHAPPGTMAIVTLLAAIVVRGIMSAVKFRVGRRLRSTALLADGWNDTVDILSGLAALTAVVLASYDPSRFLAADHYGGFAVGIVVVATGVRVMRDASLELVDTMPPEALRINARAAAARVPGVLGVEKLFARKTGLQYHVDLHIEVDPGMTVRASHDVAARVRATLREQLPWVADVLVHVEPAARTEPQRSG